MGKILISYLCDWLKVTRVSYYTWLNRSASQRAIEDIECIDLSCLKKETAAFYDDVYFNESGARKASVALANHILS